MTGLLSANDAAYSQQFDEKLQAFSFCFGGKVFPQRTRLPWLKQQQLFVFFACWWTCFLALFFAVHEHLLKVEKGDALVLNHSPLAIAIIGGLVTSTLLSRVATPVTYWLLSRHNA